MHIARLFQTKQVKKAFHSALHSLLFCKCVEKKHTKNDPQGIFKYNLESGCCTDFETDTFLSGIQLAENCGKLIRFRKNSSEINLRLLIHPSVSTSIVDSRIWHLIRQKTEFSTKHLIGILFKLSTSSGLLPSFLQF